VLSLGTQDRAVAVISPELGVLHLGSGGSGVRTSDPADEGLDS
jgi:hypothetical protein